MKRFSNIIDEDISYKAAGDALRRKQDKEREAAGLAPVTRQGASARGGAQARGGATGQRGRGGPNARGGASQARGRGGGFGTSGPRSFQQQDRNLYVHLIGHLKKQNLLPVVVFTFSKKRCEEYAATLVNLDLSTATDKSEVHVTIEKALSRLKGDISHYFRIHALTRTSRFGQESSTDRADERLA